MSTRLVPAVVCLGTFVLLMSLTTAGVGRPHQVASLTGASRVQRVVADVAPAPAAVLGSFCGWAARRGVAAAP
ncbi:MULTISPECIES: hypothetical protein [unclassified Streptomyces]|jgi:hypothetical protein|uniref:hypothetical protein n=1 Tax=unclassified Streptomyces TaxID=2593676 RepID=UPI000F507688|nr:MULTISPECIES: hypothetical protein [unclassified Streptomyces]MDH6450860.1 hypothetical protein [Streptomyces sp. SAI-119]MDH6498587.1 hypothetical protein [Streptomyces sp. SAI-149]GLP71475.1 hypothetical protein TUSST3_80950 [Streptomyces sp. TUS-ST3]